MNKWVLAILIFLLFVVLILVLWNALSEKNENFEQCLTDKNPECAKYCINNADSEIFISKGTIDNKLNASEICCCAR